MNSVWRTAQQRVTAFAGSGKREAVTSVLIVVIVAIGVVWNLPDAPITRALSEVLRPIALAVRLDQSWSVFAPAPPTRQEDIEVHVAVAYGTEKVWTLPRANPLFGVAFSHRWRKVKEALLDAPQLRPDFAHWVVGQVTGPGDRPARVDMLLRTVDIPPPGVREPGKTSVQTLYSENLIPNR